MTRVKNNLKFIGLILLNIIINTFPMFLIGRQSDLPDPLKWGLGLGYLIISSLIISLVWRAYQKRTPENIRQLKFGWKDFGIALLFWLATRAIAIGGTLLIQRVTGDIMPGNDAALQASQEQLLAMFPLFFISFQVAIGLFAPILEELIYRGLFSQIFFRQKWAKGLVSSAIFGLLHTTRLIEFPMYLALGGIFYLAYARRGSIKDAIAVHILNNGLMVIASVITYLYLLFF